MHAVDGEGNVAARNLYESIGFRIVNRYVEYAAQEPSHGHAAQI
ncbi:MAG: hypothetical protein AB1778_06265 [Candidatus Bipolaricaulota bacterium]